MDRAKINIRKKIIKEINSASDIYESRKNEFSGVSKYAIIFSKAFNIVSIILALLAGVVLFIERQLDYGLVFFILLCIIAVWAFHYQIGYMKAINSKDWASVRKNKLLAFWVRGLALLFFPGAIITLFDNIVIIYILLWMILLVGVYTLICLYIYHIDKIKLFDKRLTYLGHISIYTVQYSLKWALVITFLFDLNYPSLPLIAIILAVIAEKLIPKQYYINSVGKRPTNPILQPSS